jgi:hypothetical protein
MHIFLALFLLLACRPAGAQSLRGSISGRVVDAAARAVPDASLTITEEQTGRVRRSTASREGEFSATLVPAGSYRVEAQGRGYRATSRAIALLVNQEVYVEIPLLAETSIERVDVAGTQELLKTEPATLSTVIPNREIRNLPLDGRNFYELALLVPGAAPAALGSAGSVRGDFTMNINGAREDANYFLLDGIYNNDPKLNGISVAPPVDGVREFEVLTNSYDASFGRAAGGQINVIIQSGTNRLHGTAYEFLRNSKVDGTNYFAPSGEPSPKNIRNQFGGSLGGPIRKDKTFFFADYQGHRIREGITRTANVPTALERVGDFSQSGGRLIPIDLFTQRPFPNFMIPRARMSRVGLAIAALYPLPNRPVAGQNYVVSPVQTDRTDQFDIRLDHNIAQSSDLSFRYSMSDRDFFEPYSASLSSPTVPGFGNYVPRRMHNAMLGETHSFSPALLNEVRLGFNRANVKVHQQNQGTDVNGAVGLPSTSANPRDTGLSQIGIAGFSALGDEINNPQRNTSNVYQLTDSATWSSGRHLLRFGADIRHMQQNAFADVLSRGLIQFVGFTGNALAEMLQSAPSYTGIARLDNPQHLRTWSYNLFAQDKLRLGPNLTLMLGLRYEYNTPGVDPNDRASLYNPATGSIASVGSRGIPRAGYFADKNNLGPRIGIAWVPDAERKWAFRGGYGVYFDQAPLAPSQGLYFSPPYFQSQIFIPSQQFPIFLENPFPANYPGFVPNGAFTFQRHLRTPYLQHWNLDLQRTLWPSAVLEAAYVGSKGTKLINSRDINQAPPSPRQPNIRPNPLFLDISAYESRGNSVYHSMQAKFTQRLSRGLSALAAYTWSKSIDDASGFFSSAGDPSFPQDSNNLHADRGLSNFDVRHRFTVSYSYDLPFGSNHRLLRGWQTNGVWTFQTGRPLTVTLLPGADNSNTGIPSIGFGVVDRPNVSGDPHLSDRRPDRWFNTGAFTMPAFGAFGNAGRNILEGPAFSSVNVSLIKDTILHERLTVQLRAEVFNLLDRANFGLPDGFFGSPSFGRLVSAGTPRRVQLGLKLLF